MSNDRETDLKQQDKVRLVVSDVCDICGKPKADEKAKTNVTRFLLDESRCQCVIEKEHSEDDTRTPGPSSGLTGTVHFGESHGGLETWREKFNEAIESLPDRYDFLGVLGEGGMGTVFKVLDKTDHKLVAIKVLRTEFTHNPEALKRFEQEVKAAQCLDHRCLVKVLDHGVGKNSAPYLVMELHEGKNLGELIRFGSVSTHWLIKIFMQVAEALQYAHEHNLLHRDVKPSNIIVEFSEDGEPHVRLVDFGIAKSMFLEAAETHGLTQTGEVFGSPPYMAPEQCLGEKLTFASDIYSFGCVMFECLTGKTPFQAKNPVRMILQHLEEKPPIVSSQTKRTIPKGLDDLVKHCLQKNPSERPGSMNELRLILGNCLALIPKPQPESEAPPVVKRQNLNSGTMVILPVSSGDEHHNRKLTQLEIEAIKQRVRERQESKQNGAPLGQTSALPPSPEIRLIATFIIALIAMIVIGLGFSAWNKTQSDLSPKVNTAQTISNAPANQQAIFGTTAYRVYRLGLAYYESNKIEQANELSQFVISGSKQTNNLYMLAKAELLNAKCQRALGHTRIADEHEKAAKSIIERLTAEHAQQIPDASLDVPVNKQ